MKNSQLFSLAVSSLTVSGAMLFSYPANSAIINITRTNFSNNLLLGNRFVYAGSSGAPLKINSLTSPEFPITLIDNNNTPLVNASIVGSALPPGSPFSFELNIEDNLDKTAVLKIVENALIVATSTGIQEVPLPTFTISSNTSAGANTPFSAFNATLSGSFNGQNVVIESIYQLPGDQLNFSNTTFPVPITFNISSQPIAGYVPADQLNNFGPPVTITLTPGGSLNVPVTPTTPATPVPEPSLVVALSAMGWGVFLKRKLFKKQAKAS